MSPDHSGPRTGFRGLRIAALAGAIAAVAIVASGLYTRSRDSEALVKWTAEQSMVHVSLVRPRAENGSTTLILPGRLQAQAHAPVHARVDGYLKDWKVDIGARVSVGQLLVEIETPDLDQQLLQARADLALAEANANLNATTARRWEAMLKTNAVSRQVVDEKRGDVASSQAMVKAAQAAVDRLLATKEFSRIVAPFEGTVTARNAEVGALVNAGAGSAAPLFEISDTRQLRLYVSVPQVYVNNIALGSEADITVPEHPGRVFRASVASMSGAVDARSGSSLVQLHIDNAAGELLPGAFASVSLKLPAVAGVLSIPASALIFDQLGLRVATIDSGNAVRLKPVVIARDLGKTLEIGSGLTADDRVIENPPDGIIEGSVVAPVDEENQGA